jgi:hypothetical protein
MAPRVDTLSSLKTVSEVIALHDEVWDHSTGIIGLLKSSTRCFVVLDDEEKLAASRSCRTSPSPRGPANRATGRC